MTTPEGSTASVLIADDDALVRGVLRLALTRAGYAVVEARDAVEVLDAAATHTPDLVVLDINMPGGTVHETLGSLRDRLPDLPVLVLSGEAAPPDDLTGPACDFARKPIDLDDLLARVQRLLTGAAGSQ
ncbi:response regulator transcription factor [Microcella sp.]|uniref:response regulator transcription factor n=1 Tax=Microcella sp. TaxID=1913979 RepID=UPI00391AD312